jgi:FMN phosphatase YigB (HAD superfamily)
MLTPDVQVLLDVDNTLLDNDAFRAELEACLRRCLGDRGNQAYWRGYEQLRERLGYVDYLGTLQRLRDEGEEESALAEVGAFMLDYPFADRLYPGALAAVAHLATLAPVAVLTDGDVVFQPHKIRRAGLERAVAGQVLLCVHKEKQIAELEQRFPARHYALVDDKPGLLSRMKEQLGARLTTVWVRQGHYAREPAPSPGRGFDRCIDTIAQLRQFRREDLCAGAAQAVTPP